MSLEQLQEQLASFVREREWDQYHDPKNLASGLAVEAAELLEIFLWTSTEDADRHGRNERERVAEELGDVFIYSVMLARRLGIDLLDAAFRKLEINRKKYPVALARGNSAKYDRLGEEPQPRGDDPGGS